MNRRLAVVPVLAVALFALVACDNSTPGSANPTTGGQNTTTGSLPTTSSGGGGGSALASLQPCDLLSSSVLSQAQLTETGSGTTSGARTCNWRKSVDQNGQNGYAVALAIRDQQGLSSINTSGYTATDDQVGSHQGKQLQSTNSGDCIVVIGVTDTSRVDVSVNAGTDANQACQVANDLAKDVEPQLPAGG